MIRTSLFAVLLFPVLAFGEDASILLEKGIHAEETLGDLDRAIEAYGKVLAEHAAQKAVAAEAEFRLALCRKKKGQEDQAIAGLERVIAQYPDQKELSEEAREELAKLRPGAKALPVGKEVRRALLDEKEGRDCYLDFDTGRVLGRDSHQGFQEVTEWRRTTGVDVAGRTTGVLAFDMRVVRVEPSAWESPPEELLAHLERPVRGAASTVVVSGTDGLPHTCLFKTREGSVGILQLLRVTTEPQAAVEIRYRLLSQGLAGGGAAGSREKAARLLPRIKASFFQAALAVKAGDAGTARSAMEDVMPAVRELEKLIEGTPESKTVGLAIRQLERFDEAVRLGRLDLAAGIFQALDAVGPALEQMISKFGDGGAEKGQGRIAFRLVATEDDAGAADELVDPADSTGTSPKVRVLREVIADGSAIDSAEVREAAGGTGWEISLSLSEEGTKTLSEASAKFIGRRLAIVVDGRLVSAPLIRDRVGKEVVISGRFAYGEAALLARAIAPGAGGPQGLKKE